MRKTRRAPTRHAKGELTGREKLVFLSSRENLETKKGGRGGWRNWQVSPGLMSPRPKKKNSFFPGTQIDNFFPVCSSCASATKAWKGSKMNKFFRGWQINKFFPGRKKNKFFPSCEKKTGKSCFFFSWDMSKKESNRWRCCMSCRIKDEILLFSGSNQVCYFSNNTNVFLWFYLSYFSMFHVHTLSNCLNILIHSISWKVERKLG